MDAQTIAQVKAEAPESLWHFLVNLPTTMEAQIFYALMLSGTLGMIANYIQKWFRSEISGCLVDYLFRQNPRATGLAFFTYTSMAITAIAMHAFHVGGADQIFVGWGWVMSLGFTNGFTIDAIMNKGQKAIWTPEERAKRTQS